MNRYIAFLKVFERNSFSDAARDLGYTKPAGEEPREIALIFHDVDVINSELRMMIQNGVQSEASRLRRPVRLQWTHHADDVLRRVRNRNRKNLGSRIEILAARNNLSSTAPAASREMDIKEHHVRA